MRKLRQELLQISLCLRIMFLIKRVLDFLVIDPVNVRKIRMILHEIINDALTMQSGTTERYNINVQKNFNEIPKVNVQKVKLVHILINLIRNAKDSMLEIPAEQRILRFTTERNGAFTYIKVTDSGHGISREDLNKIFTHGYTTKKDGHGFGLHSSANYMTEMGGEMWAESEGKGKGATFVLKFSNNI